MSVTADSAKKDIRRNEDTVKIEIDGNIVHARRGEMLIDAADEVGINIPRFCYHKKLSIAANCRMCLVEVEKVPKPLPACATPVTEGMKVFTRSPRAIEAQQGTMEFLLINHPLDCPICDQGGECELQEVSIGFGSDCSTFGENKRVVQDKDIGPLISTEMTRCIHCTRCVRFGDEIAGMRELGATGRGDRMEIGTYIAKAVDSEMSGNVIDLCPVGALTSKPFRFTARAWEMQTRPSIAPHDCVGSNINVLTRSNNVMRVDPRENESINEVWISDRDRFSYEALNSPERIQRPQIRVDGQWQETDWSTALEYTVNKLKAVSAAHGTDQVGALVSPSATIEEQALLAKLMRGIGVNNIDHRLHQQDFSDQANDSVFPQLGLSIEQLEEQDAVLLIGSNIQKDQPIIGHRLRKLSMEEGTVAVVNAIDYDFNFRVKDKCISAPALMVTELAAIVIAAHEQKQLSVNTDLRALLSGRDVNETHRRIASSLVSGEATTVMLGTQALLHPALSVVQNLAALLADVTQSTLSQLSLGSNSAGACLSGCLPHRQRAGANSAVTGLDAKAMLDSGLKAYVLLNVEPEFDSADPRKAISSLMDAELVVSLSAFNSKMHEQYADVILPVTPFTETSGTYVNIEGRWQSFAAAVNPLGEARPAWKVLRVLGNLFELDGFDYVSSDEVRAELQADCDGVTNESRSAVSLTVAADNVVGLVRIADLPIYAVDGITRRAHSLQMTADAGTLTVAINATEAQRLKLANAENVTVQQGCEKIQLPLRVDQRITGGCVAIATGVAGSEALGCYGAAVEITETQV